MQTPDQPLYFRNRNEWRTWLMENHAARPDAWLAIRRKHAAGQGVTYLEAVEEAVCFGWIDGVMKSVTDEYYFLRFSRRGKHSLWSLSNQRRVERLTAQGKMTAAGLAAVREAKENGEWEAAARREDFSTLPPDFKAALAANPSAQANFDQAASSLKKRLLYWIASAKTEPTRQKRIRQVVEMAVKHKWFGE